MTLLSGGVAFPTHHFVQCCVSRIRTKAASSRFIGTLMPCLYIQITQECNPLCQSNEVVGSWNFWSGTQPVNPRLAA